MVKHLRIRFREIWIITKKTFTAWFIDDPFRQSAIIGYYAIFSIPALIVIVIACAGLIFGPEAIQGEISKQVSVAMGSETAQELEGIIAKACMRKSTVPATIIGVITLIVGSTAVFAQLQVSLNQIWEVKVTQEKMLWKNIKARLLSFGLVLSIAFLMLISLLITTALTAFSSWLKGYLPDFMVFIFYLLDFTISLAFISVLFALMFKILPDVRIRWRDVWIGAIATALLFMIGKAGLGIYFGKADPASIYGAAGSIILIMLWVSYSCMILFFGAEFTKQFTLYYGGKLSPKRGAEMILRDEIDQKIKEKREAAKK